MERNFAVSQIYFALPITDRKKSILEKTGFYLWAILGLFLYDVFATVNRRYVHYEILLMTGFRTADIWYRKLITVPLAR